MIKQTFGAIAFICVSGVAMAAETAQQPSWTFGCKLDAQATQQVESKIVEVKATEQNTWSFDDAQTQTVASR
ncbi:MAG: hypothetical protein RBS36_01115 [Thiomicrospira sp.]|jgi:hypothetical protein|nr:hypothetical protein [Thiomicrospira sp.]